MGHWRVRESRVTRKCHARFGGGPMEKYRRHRWQLAGGLPYFILGERLSETLMRPRPVEIRDVLPEHAMELALAQNEVG